MKGLRNEQTGSAEMDVDQRAWRDERGGIAAHERVGQRFRARFLNRTGTDSTLHWHGMIIPNDMDGVPNITQKPVPDGGTFIYDFMPAPAGFRWYHSHVSPQTALGLFGAFIIDDPRDDKADVEAVLVFHDVPNMQSFRAAVKGMSNAPMIEPPGLHGQMKMKNMKMGAMQHMDMKHMAMGDEVGYLAHCVNGAAYPHTKPV